MSYEGLFQPIKIGRVEIKNRIAMAPMNINFTREGHFSEQHMAYFAARASVQPVLLGLPVVAPYSAAASLIPTPCWKGSAEFIRSRIFSCFVS